MCDVEETDIHLFFTCHFARVAWFSFPWFIRSEVLAANCNSLSQILLKFLTMNHPHASLENILTFMWCIWKSRNDNLFDRKQGAPHQVYQAAKAIQKNMEMFDPTAISPLQVQEDPGNEYGNRSHAPNVDPPPPQLGSTLNSDLQIVGAKIFSDASWKSRNISRRTDSQRMGIGLYLQFQVAEASCNVMIPASAEYGASPLKAEATALLLAAKVAQLFQLQGITFLTDNLVLAKASATQSISAQEVPWEIRNDLASFFQVSAQLQASIFHIRRDLNGVAHECAHQALKTNDLEPIFRCSSSAHSNSQCPTYNVLQSANIAGYVLHSVHCS